MTVRLLATRVELDRSRPCLACGAPWRVVLRNPGVLPASNPDAAGQAVHWTPESSGCSAECWREDADAYDRGILARSARGWLT
jgi:hypothetical protein